LTMASREAERSAGFTMAKLIVERWAQSRHARARQK
jgi:hypothetical protein